MTHMACTLTRRLAPMLGPALVVAALGCREDAESPTAPEPGPALDIRPAQALSFRQVSTGRIHTCGVTTEDQAYCWGADLTGQLGTSTVPGLCNLDPCSTRPVAVEGGLRFRQVSAGREHTCAVNPFDRAFCWGANTRGQLGDNATTLRRTPVRVVGGLRFRQVNASDFRHTCGVTTGNLAYCWGRNDDGELGDGTLRNRRKPNPVAGAT